MVTGRQVNYMAFVVCTLGGGLRWLLVTSAVTVLVLPPAATDITGKSNTLTDFVLFYPICTNYNTSYFYYELSLGFSTLSFYVIQILKIFTATNYKYCVFY